MTYLLNFHFFSFSFFGFSSLFLPCSASDGLIVLPKKQTFFFWITFMIINHMNELIEIKKKSEFFKTVFFLYGWKMVHF